MKHLLSIDDISANEIKSILSLASKFKSIDNITDFPALNKKVVLALFENSTRTQSSFDLAAQGLSMSVLNFSSSNSSTSKGESLRDTIETLDSLDVDCFVVRHKSSGVPKQMSNWTQSAIVNAGDGTHQHPTQALVDCFTIQSKLGSLENKKILICGDIDQRVARSNIGAFSKMGAEVFVVGPKTMMPDNVKDWPIKIFPNLDDLLGEIDVLYLVRIQKERKGRVLLPSLSEYHKLYGLTKERLLKLKDTALVMHPGPMNRGVEIDGSILDDERVSILDQVSSGIPVRMAVFYTLLSSEIEMTRFLEGV